MYSTVHTLQILLYIIQRKSTNNFLVLEQQMEIGLCGFHFNMEVKWKCPCQTAGGLKTERLHD